jgi:hypothetical protein
MDLAVVMHHDVLADKLEDGRVGGEPWPPGTRAGYPPV